MRQITNMHRDIHFLLPSAGIMTRVASAGAAAAGNIRDSRAEAENYIHPPPS